MEAAARYPADPVALLIKHGAAVNARGMVGRLLASLLFSLIFLSFCCFVSHLSLFFFFFRNSKQSTDKSIHEEEVMK